MRSAFIAMVMVACVVMWMVMATIGKAAEPKEQLPKVGTYDPRAIVVIYYNSKGHQDEIKSMMAERDKAKAAGDQAKVKALEAKGEAMQELALQQLAGKAPMDDLVGKLTPNWAEVAKAAGVDVIVSKVEYKRRGVELIDVSEALAEHLGAGEKEKVAIRQLMAQKKK